MSAEESLTLAEVARVLGVTKCRAWQLLRGGKLRGRRRANVWFVDAASVRAQAAAMDAARRRREARRAKRAEAS